MVIYCAHEFGGNPENIRIATEKMRKIQLNNLEHTFLSPLHCFSFIDYGEIPYDTAMELCLDVVMLCDEVWVISENISEGVRREIILAEKLNIPVRFVHSV